MNTAVGYSALIEKFNLRVIQHFRQSYIASHGRGFVKIENHREIHVYQKTYALKNPKNVFEQLEFAIKYDGINLEILHEIFNNLDETEFEQYIADNQTSKYMRILWFLFEFLVGKELIAPTIRRLKYIDVLDRETYFTSKGIKSQRHKVINNLLGSKEFSPIVRRTEIINNHIGQNYDEKALILANKYDPQLIARASHYLFTKETLSSYQIEQVTPSKDRVAKFINTLKESTTSFHLDKKHLVELQNIIVDPRFQDKDYRVNQNYVGENLYLDQRIHYISPKPENVEILMQGLFNSLSSGFSAELHPVVIAAMISFGFVFIHPFEDGNGRIHRFLIHYILSKQNFTPKGIIFPVSAVMLKKIHEYDQVLESFSKQIMTQIDDYSLSNDGILTVKQNTLNYYKFIDYTSFVEYLFGCIKETLEDNFQKELEFLVKYDQAKLQMQSVIDMPDRLIDLFIKFVMQNHGTLGKQKRTDYFEMLTDKEIIDLQNIIRTTILGLH